MGHGFNIVSRSQWGAEQPRSRIWRSVSAVTTVYIHWPGSPGPLREQIEIPTLDELLALADEAQGRRVDELPDVLRVLRVPEEQAVDCLLPPDLVERAQRIDTRAEERAWMRDTQRFHKYVRLWADFAYNYAEFQSGRIYAGRTYRVVPASQAPYNTSGVSLCCVVGAPDRLSSALRENLRDFVAWTENYGPGRRRELRVRGHRDVNQTTCPGPRLAALVPKLDRI